MVEKDFANNMKRYYLLTVIILIFINFILRIPSFTETNRYADEDIYLTIGKGLRNNLVLYRNIHDNKPPAIYYTAAMADTVPNFRFILFIVHSGSIIAFYFLSLLLFKKKLLAGLLTSIYLIFTTIPLLEGNIANGEIFMIIPEIFAVWLFWEIFEMKNKYQAKNFMIVGLLFCAGFFYKVTAAFDFAAVIIFWIIMSSKSFRQMVKLVKNPNLWYMVAGFVTPILASLIFFFLKGAGAYYLRQALLQNIGYLNSSTGGSNTHLVIKGVAVILLLTFFYWKKNKLNKKVLFCLIWFTMALFGALMSGRPYPHYLIQIVAPATLLLGFGIFGTKIEKKVTAFLAIITIVAIYSTKFWHYQSWPYYENFIQYAIGQKTRSQYIDFFGGALRNQQIANYIRLHTLKDEKIFVWGTEPAIYAASGRLPVGRFTTSYHIRDFDRDGVAINLVKQTFPRYIIVMDYESDFSGLLNWIGDNYIPVSRIDDATIYKLFTTSLLNKL